MTSWAEILQDQSPEGAAKVAQLRDAEAHALDLQERVMAAITDGVGNRARLFEAYGQAMLDIDRLRQEVCRMAQE